MPGKWDAEAYEKKAHGQRKKRDSGQEDTPFLSPPAPAARISPHSPARKMDSTP